jgi:hypothetical protein
MLGRLRKHRTSARPRLDCLEGRDVPATPVGPEFTPHTSLNGGQITPAVATDAAGNYVMVWVNKTSPAPYTAEDIFARRYAADGTPLGAEFLVNTYTDYEQMNPAVAMDADGDFVVVWQTNDFEGTGLEIRGQRYDPAGAPVGGEFQVNTTTLYDQTRPDVTMDADGDFVVVWETLVETTPRPEWPDQRPAVRRDRGRGRRRVPRRSGHVLRLVQRVPARAGRERGRRRVVRRLLDVGVQRVRHARHLHPERGPDDPHLRPVVRRVWGAGHGSADRPCQPGPGG